MKAIDYFNKYGLSILETDKFNEMFKEMNDEAKEIAKNRGSDTNSTMISILKEMNQKWNKLCSIYEEEYKLEVLVRNGYINFWKRHIPELR